MTRVRGKEKRRGKHLKLEFYFIADEEMMGYVDQNQVQVNTIIHSIPTYHITKAIDNIITAISISP